MTSWIKQLLCVCVPACVPACMSSTQCCVQLCFTSLSFLYNTPHCLSVHLLLHAPITLYIPLCSTLHLPSSCHFSLDRVFPLILHLSTLLPPSQTCPPNFSFLFLICPPLLLLQEFLSLFHSPVVRPLTHLVASPSSSSLNFFSTLAVIFLSNQSPPTHLSFLRSPFNPSLLTSLFFSLTHLPIIQHPHHHQLHSPSLPLPHLSPSS